jgi:hypothetical protein
MSFKYSAFVSYSSKDKPWAERLRKDLTAQLGGTVYWDSDRLEEGRPWNDQLTTALTSSEHLVVFYSDHAHQSDWVKHEMSVFNTFAGAEFGKSRRLLCVQTEADKAPVVYPQIQHVRGLLGRDVYGTVKPDDLAGDKLKVWNDLITRIRTRLLSNAQILPLALVAMTEDEVDELAWSKPDPGSRFHETLGMKANELGIADQATLKVLYGPSRGDWKPFQSSVTIDAILGTVLGDLNKSMHPMRYEWDAVDPLSTTGDWKSELARLSGPAVILVDPLSLYHPRIKDRFQLLNQCFEKDDVVFLTLAPFCVTPPYTALRTLVQVLTSPMLDPYFEPVPTKTRIAACAVGIGDRDDLGRAIRAALLRGAAQASGQPNSFIAPPRRLS